LTNITNFDILKTGGGWPVVRRCLINILEAGSTPVPPTKQGSIYYGKD
jgi:hypothetical protein